MFFRSPVVVALFFASVSLVHAGLIPDPSSRIVISVRDQKLMLVKNGAKMAVYPVSTSKFGLGDDWGRMTTPLGFLEVVQKIGDQAPSGAVFHNRRLTGEVLRPNAPGRDPIVTRIIWLSGLEASTAHAFNRCIYIHGTPQERNIGRPASYGCIRMKSNDVTALYNQVPLGTVVQILQGRLPTAAMAATTPIPQPPTPVVKEKRAAVAEKKSHGTAPPRKLFASRRRST